MPTESPPVAAAEDGGGDDDRRDDARDVQCVRCAYHLYGIADAARCPECGLPVYWTTRAPRKLSQYPAGWVATMARAVRLLLLAYATPAVLMLGLLTRTFEEDALPIPLAVVAAAVAHLVGMWMLARPSHHWTEPPQTTVRFVLRAAPIGPLVSAAAVVMTYISFRWELETIGTIGLVVGVPGPTAAFLRMRVVARMIADEGLAEHSGIVAWGFCFTVVYVATLIMLDRWTRWSALSVHHALLVLPAMVAVILFLLWGAYLMLCCAVDFGRAAKVARDAWRADAPLEEGL